VNNRKKKSVTILTGALGSGKTTLLNNIVKGNPDKKFVIIENEFGEINIDKKLIGSLDTNNIFELTNGCICCSLSGELGLLLNMLIMSDVQFDHLIIETTGIADPNQFVQLFLSGSRANKYFELDNVICLIDAKHFYLQFEQIDEVKRQIISADTILINKIDSVDEEKVLKITKIIKSLNNDAFINKTTHSSISDIDILDVRLHTVDKLETSFKPTSFHKVTSETEKFSVIRLEQHHHNHNHEIESFSISIDGEFDLTRFAVWLDNFLFFSGEEIYRFKGIINAQDSNSRFVLQGVYKTFSFFEGSPWKENEQRTNQFVFIGKNLKKEDLTQYMSSLVINAENTI
jgi:G3E family GTPase